MSRNDFNIMRSISWSHTSRMKAAAVVFLALLAGARAVPSVPPPVGTSAMKLQGDVDAAVAAGAVAMTIPAGIYVFSNTNMLLAGTRDLAIDARGVTLQVRTRSSTTPSSTPTYT